MCNLILPGPSTQPIHLLNPPPQSHSCHSHPFVVSSCGSHFSFFLSFTGISSSYPPDIPMATTPMLSGDSGGGGVCTLMTGSLRTPKSFPKHTKNPSMGDSPPTNTLAQRQNQSHFHHHGQQQQRRQQQQLKVGGHAEQVNLHNSPSATRTVNTHPVDLYQQQQQQVRKTVLRLPPA